MKILSRNQKVIQAVQDRKDQIDEGVSLAEKIDTLRRTFSELQRQNYDFVSGMKDSLERETRELRTIKEDLMYEIEVLKEKLLNYKK